MIFAILDEGIFLDISEEKNAKSARKIPLDFLPHSADRLINQPI